jgi:hypothetical protein
VLVAHTPCVAHGEFTHESGDGHHQADALPSSDAEGTPGRANLTSADVHAEHDHCAIASARREKLAIVPRGDPIVRGEGPAGVHDARDEQRRCSIIAILFLAPKNSPPA